MKIFLSKEGVRYHEVVSYNKVQDFFSLLVLFVIFKISMYPLKAFSGCTNMIIKVSSNEEFFTTRHSYNHVLQVFLELSLDIIVKPTYGAYTLMKFKIKSPIINLIMMIMSPCLLTITTSFLRLL
jgi:hypothetical protein